MTNERIGSFIAAVRKERNLTQEQLAERIGVSNRSVSRWENGKTLPDLSLMRDICRALDVTMPELLQGERMNAVQETEQTVALMVAMAEAERKQRTREVNRCLIPGILLVAAALVWGNFLSAIPGLGLLVLGVFRNSRNRPMSDRELRLLSRKEEDLQMKTAEEMIRFSRKHKKIELSQQRKAFSAIEKALTQEEYALFAMTAAEYSFDGNPGIWHGVLVLTNRRLLFCGESVRGRLMTHYSPEWLDRQEIRSVEAASGKLRIQSEGNTVTVTGENMASAAEKLKKALDI